VRAPRTSGRLIARISFDRKSYVLKSTTLVGGAYFVVHAAQNRSSVVVWAARYAG